MIKQSFSYLISLSCPETDKDGQALCETGQQNSKCDRETFWTWHGIPVWGKQLKYAALKLLSSLKAFGSVFFQCFQSQSSQKFDVFSSMSPSLERRSTFQESLSFPFLKIGWGTNLSCTSTKPSRQQEEEKSKMSPTPRSLGQLSSPSSNLEVESGTFSYLNSEPIVHPGVTTECWTLREFLDPSGMWVNKAASHCILLEQT